MGSIVHGIFTVILSAQIIFGNVANGFIVLVNCMDWVKKRKMSPADQILTLLAISRFIKLWIAYSYWWVLESYPSLWVNAKGVRSVSVIFTIVNHFSIWLATILSIFYFLKIANFSQSIFFYLKGRAKKVISAIQLVSLILLIVTTIVLDIQIDAYMDEYKRNVSYSFNSRDSAELLQIILFTNFEFTLIPFTVSLAACLLLIFSLWKHLKQMQRHSTGSRDASTMAHVKALQSVVAFLLLYTLFILSFLLQIWTFKFLQRDTVILFFRSIGLAFPSGHSIVLILGNRKLKQVAFLVMRWLRCWFNHRKITEPTGHFQNN